MEAERYNRQIILNGFGEAAQHKLSDARVLVVGAGGLGCPALQYLAAAGLGHIGIVDDDIIALSNLHRQILFGTTDIGQLKVDVAAKRLQEMNPGIEIITYPLRLEKSNALNILGSYDLILDGTDNFQSRYLINDACALLDKPLVFAAVSGYEGQLAIFSIGDDAEQRANYRDLFPVPPEPGEIPNCAESGVLGVLPGILGTMAAAEIIKLITGIGKPLINKLIHYNLLSNEQYEMSISPADDYKMPKTEFDFFNMEYEYSRKPTKGYIEIDAPQLTSLQREASTLIIDVRERHEVPVLDSGIFNQIPMSEFGAFLKTDVSAQNIVLICQHGIRSVAAAEALQEKYGCTKKIYSLKGGIVKWRDHFLKDNMSDRKVKNIFVRGKIDPAFIAESISKHSSKTTIGGHSIFMGQVRRDELDSKFVAAIEFTAYEELALEKMQQIREDIFKKYPLSCMHVHHSLGTIQAGEICLFVFTSSAHRKPAIDACTEIVERLKAELPVWGKEIFEDDTHQWKENG